MVIPAVVYIKSLRRVKELFTIGMLTAKVMQREAKMQELEMVSFVF